MNPTSPSDDPHEPRLFAAPSLSWFHQRGRVYVYHDRFGDLLEMSPDLRELLQFFADGQTRQAARRAFTARLDPNTLERFIEAFIEHACLLSSPEAERAMLVEAFPIRGPWVVTYLHEEGHLEAIIGRNPETPPRRALFDPWETALWQSLDGEQTCAALAATLHERFPDRWRDARDALDATLDAITRWTHSDVQLTRVSRVRLSFYRRATAPRPPYLGSTMPFERLVDDDDPSRDGDGPNAPMIDLRDYHRDQIEDAAHQFDEVETTLSHLFRHPHPALSGETYAGRLLAVLGDREMLRDDSREVIEIGGGVGFFAAGFLDALRREHPERFAAMRYRVLDISPALHASQRRMLSDFAPRAEVALMDAESLTLPDESVDLAISNEMIGDLRTARVTWTPVEGAAASEEEEEEEAPPWFDPEDDYAGEQDLPRTLGGDPEAVAALERYDVPLHDAPEAFHVNLGAIRLLEHLWRVLKPGGAAILTEFGDLWKYPVESIHLDHAEFSIHFGQLCHIARRLGFRAEVEEVFELLRFDPDVETLACTRTYFRNLQALFTAHDLTLEKVAWTRPQLAAHARRGGLSLARIETLSWRPLEARVMGLAPREFKALLLLKPASR